MVAMLLDSLDKELRSKCMANLMIVIKQARKLRSYASPKLSPTDFLTHKGEV